MARYNAEGRGRGSIVVRKSELEASVLCAQPPASGDSQAAALTEREGLSLAQRHDDEEEVEDASLLASIDRSRSCSRTLSWASWGQLKACQGQTASDMLSLLPAPAAEVVQHFCHLPT